MGRLEIRPAATVDEQTVVRLAVDNRMFAADEVDGLVDAFRAGVGDAAGDHWWWVATVEDDRPAAAAYVAPEPFADRVWNLYFLAVDPGSHGSGLGSALVLHVEQTLRALGDGRARVLVVETSSTDQYARTREFYRARGFAEEARIREYYGPQDDKVVFWRSLTVDEPGPGLS